MFQPVRWCRPLSEWERLQKENADLRRILLENGLTLPPSPTAPGTALATTPEQLALFRALFRGRDDVYAQGWVSRRTPGKMSYSPARVRAWEVPGSRMVRPPTVDWASLPYAPLTDDAVLAHLSGRKTIGIYPLLDDDTCWFLVADFDKSNWYADARAYVAAADALGLPVALERSRSGNGGHAWLFFTHPVSASRARLLGACIAQRALRDRAGATGGSFDRFFPSQDAHRFDPKGSSPNIGNLIALPFQPQPMRQENSVFLNRDGKPVPDQWAYLASLRLLSPEGLDAVLGPAAPVLPASGSRGKKQASPRVSSVRGAAGFELPPVEPLASSPAIPHGQGIVLVRSHMLFLEKTGLSDALIASLRGLSRFKNPAFFQAQQRKKSIHGLPVDIDCSLETPDHVVLPRGVEDALKDLCAREGLSVSGVDQRQAGTPLNVRFVGTLRPDQEEAVASLAPYDSGILKAGTGFGKSVVIGWAIAQRQVNTLVVVKGKNMMRQMQSELAAVLSLPASDIGIVVPPGRRRTGKVDIMLVRTGSNQDRIQPWVRDYGQIIYDECHGAAAPSATQLLRYVRPRYLLGLTANVRRKDGLHPLTVQHLGPVRHAARSRRKEAGTRTLERLHWALRTPPPPQTSDRRMFAVLVGLLLADGDRSAVLADRIVSLAKEEERVLVLTSRTHHAEELAQRCRTWHGPVYCVHGKMREGDRDRILGDAAAATANGGSILVSTHPFLGQSYNNPHLTTLVMASPVSFEGLVEQCVGRIERDHAGARAVSRRIVDACDTGHPMLERMSAKRHAVYRKEGYGENRPPGTGSRATGS